MVVGPPSADVAVTQFYDTNVVDNASGYAITLTTLPEAARAGREPSSLHELAELLDLELLFDVPTDPSHTYLPHAFAAVLADGDPSDTFQRLSEFPELRMAAGRVGIDPELLRFAEYCTFQPVLAIEASALHKEVLAALLAASGVVAVAASPAGPIVIAYFAGSILAGGAAATVVKVGGKWVERRFPR